MLSWDFIVVLLITIVFGLILGLTVTMVVDRKLSNISINIPKISIDGNQCQPVKQSEILKNKETYEQFTAPIQEEDIVNSKYPAQPKDDTHNVTNITHSPPEKTLSDKNDMHCASEMTLKKSIPPAQENQIIGGQILQQTQPIVGCMSDKDCNIIYGNGENKCLSTHQCYCMKGSGNFCQYGPTYYKDPKDMTERERKYFKESAKIYKMTLQDYINWLNLYIDEQSVLPTRHLLNLQKIIKGIPITRDDIPRDLIPPPLTAQEYFQKISQIDDQMVPKNNDTAGPQIPANYMEYSQFELPRNLKHLDNRTLDDKLYKYDYRQSVPETRPIISHEYEKLN